MEESSKWLSQSVIVWCFAWYLNYFSTIVSTPEAVANISRSIHLASKQVKKQKLASIPPSKIPTTSQLTSRMGDLSFLEDSPGNTTSFGSRGVPTPNEGAQTTSMTLCQSELSKASATKTKGRPKKPTTYTSMGVRPATTRSQSSVRPQVQSDVMSTTVPSTTRPRTSASSTRNKPTHSRQAPTATQLYRTPNARPKTSTTSSSVRPPLFESMPHAHEILADQV